MKKILSMALAAVLILGLAAPALAYTTPDFSDLPSDNWAYGPVMRMADQGYIQGTGNNQFSPTMKVSAAQFLTLVGRIAFPETKVNEGDTWYGPYVAAAEANGLLSGTQVDPAAPEAEITRYDMAVILRAAAKKLGKAETLAQQSQVTDFGMIPNMYTEAVLAVYGMGLITGDQNGNFNGSNTMMRNELATVIDRLVALKSPGGTTTEPTASPEPSSTPEVTPSPVPEIPDEPQIVTGKMKGALRYYPIQGKAGWWTDGSKLAPAGIPYKLLYTEDGGATSQLILEGQTSEPYSEFDSEFPINKALLENPNGQFFISAETEIEGQKHVTQDRRTDGRQTISTVEVYEKGTRVGTVSDVALVPPTGQKWDFELKGKVPDMAMALVATTGPNIPPDLHKISPAGFSVQLVCYPEPNIQNHVPTGERIIIGETKANEDGSFVMSVSIDTVDMVSTKSFCIEFRGAYNGVEYFSLDVDELRTLSDIKSHWMNAAWSVNLYHN